MEINMKYFIFVTLFMIVSGCSIIETKVCDTHCNIEEIEKRKRGIAYYLPKRLMKLSVTRAKVEPAKLLQALAVAKKQVNDADTRNKAAKNAKEKADRILKHAEGDAGNTAVVKLRELAHMANAEFTDSKEKLAVAKTSLVTATANVNAADAKFKDNIKLELLPSIPDKNKLFVATLNHYSVHDDELDISTTENGLLQSVKATKTDKTGDILVEAAKTIIEIAKVVTGVPASSLQVVDRGIPKDTKFAFTYEYIFDPSEETELKEINKDFKKLRASEYEIKVKIGDKEVGGKSNPATIVNLNKLKSEKDYKGLIYRMPLPYTVSIYGTSPNTVHTHDDGTSCTKGHTYPLETTLEMIPNGGSIGLLPFKAGLFVTSHYDVEFKKGMLVKRDATRPGGALEFISIPFKIANAIVAIPTEFIQLKVDYSSKHKELLEQQKLLLEAQEELRITKKELQNTQENE